MLQSKPGPIDPKNGGLDVTRKSTAEKKGVLEDIKFYSKEFIFAIKLGLLITSSFYPIFYSITLILTTSDINNKNEVYLSKLFMFIGTFCNIIFLIVNTFYPLLRFRRRPFIIGLLMLLASWLLLLASFITGVVLEP